jgi:hypothetical protein
MNFAELYRAIVPVRMAIEKHYYCLVGGRDHEFESHSGHGCLVFVNVYVFFCVCEHVEALR